MSTRGIRVLFVLVVVAAIALVVIDRSPLGRRIQDRVLPEPAKVSLDVQRYHGGAFTVINVVDGDTLDIDARDRDEFYTRIRLLGIDTPEITGADGKAHFGDRATEKVKELCFNQQVRVFLDDDDSRGYYGRLLAYVQLPDERFLNEVLLREGYAYADRRFEHSMYHKYLELENLARIDGRGLWKDAEREDLPKWLREKEPKLLLEK